MQFKTTSNISELISRAVEENISISQQLVPLYPQIQRAGDLLADAYQKGNQALFMGNGGSAAEAQHLAAELVGRFAMQRRPLSALALHTNTSATTAISNDLGYEEIYSRQLEAHARPGDVAIILSTSGRSPNVVAAAKKKEALKICCISFTGEDPGPLRSFSDVILAVPSRNVPRIQELHLLIGHILCGWVEQRLFGD